MDKFIGDKSDDGQDTSLRVEMGNTGLILVRREMEHNSNNWINTCFHQPCDWWSACRVYCMAQ